MRGDFDEDEYDDSLHYCEVCCRDILIGQLYRDGGYSRRAHVRCLELPAPEPTSETARTGDAVAGKDESL